MLRRPRTRFSSTGGRRSSAESMNMHIDLNTAPGRSYSNHTASTVSDNTSSQHTTYRWIRRRRASAFDADDNHHPRHSRYYHRQQNPVTGPIYRALVKNCVSEDILDGLPEPPTIFRLVRYRYREYIAELLGTYILTLLTIGTTVTSRLNDNAKHQGYTLLCLSSGLALMMGLFITQGVSGGHINPSITLTFTIWKGFPLHKVPGYLFFQFLGAFAGAATAHLLFLQSINAFSGTVRTVTGSQATAGLFTSFPIPPANHATIFYSLCLANAVFIAAVLAVTDSANIVPRAWGPLAVGLFLSSILFSLAYQTGGGGINVAIDLGARLYIFAVGYGPETFTAYNHYAYIPSVAPLCGAIIGGTFYYTFVVTRRRACQLNI
ncbi:glycerol channel [Tieghemiomyces parasiticus]|uniref:Glycerol channel n=1 Tax=Tieghemiomyces parasiticus TaxID=78921 RepID=A0A9W8A845_9FUNG|nr:glycerol channel [Tieghemiomyces parasiticus]